MMREEGYFEIKLNGNWRNKDLSAFLNSIENIFRAYYVCHDITEMYRGMIEQEREGRFGPFFDEYFYALRRYIRDDEFRGRSFPFPFPLFQFGNIFESIENDTYLIPDDDLLKIKRIHIASPGEIQIEAGGVVREVRELIKDLTFRNSQEQRLRELEILSKKLDILERLGVPKSELGKVLGYVKSNGKVLEDLHRRELVGNIVDIDA